MSQWTNYYLWVGEKLGIDMDFNHFVKLYENGKLPENLTLDKYLDTLLPKIKKEDQKCYS